jgi:Alpha/beta hydrolase domain
MMAMGLDHLIQWVDKGKVPPRADRILVQDGAIVLDLSNNAKGGVRNTYVDVPVAEYGVPNAATGNERTSLSTANRPLRSIALSQVLKIQ